MTAWKDSEELSTKTVRITKECTEGTNSTEKEKE